MKNTVFLLTAGLVIGCSSDRDETEAQKETSREAEHPIKAYSARTQNLIQMQEEISKGVNAQMSKGMERLKKEADSH